MTDTTTSTDERITISPLFAATTMLVLLFAGTIWTIAAVGLANQSATFLAFILAGAGAGLLLFRRFHADPASSDSLFVFAAGIVSACLGLVLFLTGIVLGG